MTNSFIGQTFGKYQITSLLGRGGMAEVYLAHDPQLDRDVAIKLMHPHLADEEGFAQRFINEARAVARLRHPNIVQVFEYDLSDGRPYMVMEYLDGQTLKERLAKLRESAQTMALADAARIAAAIGAAIAYAHDKGMVHRDIKPSNILFTRADDTPILADFGIAKFAGQTMHTASGSVTGTPAYMAPEQAQGSAHKRSDLYSFAVVVYEMLTGHTPFSAETPVEMLMQHMQQTPPAPRTWRADLPPALDDVFRKALAKNPDERYQTAAELVSALQAALAGQLVASAPQDAPTIRENVGVVAPRAEPKPAASSNAPPTVGMRVLKLLDSMAFFVAPLIGRQRVQMNQDTEDRRELLASVMAVVGVLLAALQLLAGTLDLISRTFAPIIQLPPLLIVGLLALGGVATWNMVRLTASPVRRRRALVVLGIVAAGALAWGGWLLYDKTRPPTGPIVVIADFQRCKTCDEIEYGQRIYRYVKLETDRLKLPNLEVRYVLESYPDAATARARGADYKATLVIWGSYDKTGLIPHFELLRAPDRQPQHFVQPEELSVAEFHLQGGDREVAFMALLGLGLIRYAEGDYATALSLYDAGLQTLGGDASRPAPNAEVAYFYKALTQYASGEAWQVIADNLKKVVAIKPTWADAHYLLAVTYLSACKPDGSNASDLALSEGETAIQLRADANNYWVRGESQSRLGRWAEAAKSFEQSLKLKDDPGVRSALIITYRKLGRQDLVEQESKRLPSAPAVSSASDDVDKLRDEAYQLYYQGHLADATLRYQQAISRAVELKRSNTIQASLYRDLGDTYAAQTQYEAAVSSYLKSESLWGKNWSGYASIAFVYQHWGKDNEAIGAYQKAIDNMPCDYSAHTSLADLYAKQGNSSRAIAAYRQAIIANPLNGLAYVSMAIQLEADGKTNEANDALQKALPLLEEQLRQEPTNANLAYVLGSTYYRVNQFAPALVAFQKYATLAPNDRQSHYWIGATLYELKRYPEAIAELEQANKAYPNSTLTLSKLADAYREVNRIEDAIAVYQQIVALDPKDASAWLGLGQIADQQQRWADAAKAYETLVTLIPKDPQAHTALAFAYFNLNRMDEAVKEFRAAVALQPNVGYYQTNLALALETIRQHDEAITVAQRALQLDATQIVAHYVLGLAYKAKGDKAKAASEFQVVAQSAAVTPALKQAAEQELLQLGA